MKAPHSCVDFNILVYAHRQDLPENAEYRRPLERLANNDQPSGLSDLSMSGFVRVVSNRSIFREPTTADAAWQAVEALLAAPAAMHLNLASAIGGCSGDSPEISTHVATMLPMRTLPPTPWKTCDMAERGPGFRAFPAAALGTPT